jgi:hypothetical protein
MRKPAFAAVLALMLLAGCSGQGVPPPPAERDYSSGPLAHLRYELADAIAGYKIYCETYRDGELVSTDDWQIGTEI